MQLAKKSVTSIHSAELFKKYSGGSYMQETSFFDLLKNENLDDLSWSIMTSACKTLWDGFKMSQTEFTDIVTGVGDILDSTVLETIEKMADPDKKGTYDLSKLESLLEKR